MMFPLHRVLHTYEIGDQEDDRRKSGYHFKEHNDFGWNACRQNIPVTKERKIQDTEIETFEEQGGSTKHRFNSIDTRWGDPEQAVEIEGVRKGNFGHVIGH
jgi:hypothetical protein